LIGKGCGRIFIPPVSGERARDGESKTKPPSICYSFLFCIQNRLQILYGLSIFDVTS
jgi:hypothetical protein